MKKILVAILFVWMQLSAASLQAQTVIQQFAAVSRGAGEVSDMDLPQPTGEGSTLIAMPELLSPDITVESITDNAPDGGNTYKKVTAATSSCSGKTIEIWYCEKCKANVSELKFHLSGHVMASINGFMEVSGLALSSVLDGKGAQVSDGTDTAQGLEVGPRIVTTAPDFIVARYSSASHPTGVSPKDWTYKTTYVYGLNLPAGTYQPTLTGGKSGGSFCMGMAAFKSAAPAPAAPQN
jgi:hypothetical protein